MNLHEKKLSTTARKALPKSDFVFPKGRRYPIEDKSHARNALARVSQHGSSSEKAKVRAAVHSKYPDIGKEESLIDQLVPAPPVEEHCGVCPEDMAKRRRIGTDVEKEHFKGGRNVDTTPRAVAQTHMRENPHYYPARPKPRGAKEALRWVQ